MNRIDAAREIARLVSEHGWEAHLFARSGQSWVTLTFLDPEGTEHRMEFTRASVHGPSEPSSILRGRQCCARMGGHKNYCLKSELHSGLHRDYEGRVWATDDISAPARGTHRLATVERVGDGWRAVCECGVAVGAPVRSDAVLDLRDHD